MAEPTDFELMAQIQERERRAHFVLKDRYRKRLFEIAFAVLKSPHQAEEVANQVFEFCWRQADLFDLERDRSVAIWLYEMAGFYARERLRRWPWSKPITPDGGASTPQRTWVIPVLVVSLLGLGAYAAWLTQQQWGGRSTASASTDAIQQLTLDWQKDSETQRILLRDPQFRGNMLGQVLWSPTDRQAILLGTNIPPAPQGKSYQFWAQKTVDPGKRIESAGIFATLDDGTVQWLSPSLDIESPDLFLVTLEPGGGSEQPTGPVLLQNSTADTPKASPAVSPAPPQQPN